MSSLHITTQSIEHVLSTSTTFWDSVLSVGVGSFLAALAVAIFSEWSLRRRDAAARRREEDKETRETEATLNWQTEMLSYNMFELHDSLRLLGLKRTLEPLKSYLDNDASRFTTLHKASPNAALHLNNSISAIIKFNKWIASNKETISHDEAIIVAKEGYAHSLCALLWIQQCKNYKLTIERDPELYLSDKLLPVIKDLVPYIKNCIEVTDSTYELDPKAFIKAYEEERNSILTYSLRKRKN